MNIGFTTGFLDKISLTEKMNLFVEFGCKVVEINLMDFERLELVKNELERINFNFFNYQSVHAPCYYKDAKIDYGFNGVSVEVLSKIEKFCDKYQVSFVVFHPDLVSDFTIFSKYNIPVAFENMDWRKKNYKTVDEMKNLFFQIDAEMVLDVNHCYTIDRGTKLANEMLVEFGDRIKEIHLSGFTEYHEPLYKTEQVELVKIVSQLNVPVIVESVCETVEEYKLEFSYITKNS